MEMFHMDIITDGAWCMAAPAFYIVVKGWGAMLSDAACTLTLAALTTEVAAEDHQGALEDFRTFK